jgi:hypothetical protein
MCPSRSAPLISTIERTTASSSRPRAEARFVNLGGSIVPHDPFFSREAASDGSVTVPVVAAHGVMGAMRRAGVSFSLGSSRRLTLQGFARCRGGLQN